MSDHDELVKRLRARLSSGPNTVRTPWGKTIEEAAAEIERLASSLTASRAREGRMREALTVCATEFHSVVSFKGLELVADEFCRRITLAAKALTAAPADAQGAGEGEAADETKQAIRDAILLAVAPIIQDYKRGLECVEVVIGGLLSAGFSITRTSPSAIRNAALEEAAKTAENFRSPSPYPTVYAAIAAAIRALQLPEAKP